MMKLSWILSLLLATVGSLPAQELRIVTFNYPPYTIAETRAGVVERRVDSAMTSRSIKVRWEYFPVARAFHEFLADGEALFAGNIGQFPESDQRSLRYVVTMKTTGYTVSRTAMKGQSLEKKTFVGLRHDSNLISQATKYHSPVVEVNSMRQAFEMVSLGRADVVLCLDQEIEELKKYPNLTILPELTRTVELQLIYHENSVAGGIVKKVARESNNFTQSSR
jgi:hypothetical protein